MPDSAGKMYRSSVRSPVDRSEVGTGSDGTVYYIRIYKRDKEGNDLSVFSGDILRSMGMGPEDVAEKRLQGNRNLEEVAVYSAVWTDILNLGFDIVQDGLADPNAIGVDQAHCSLRLQDGWSAAQAELQWDKLRALFDTEECVVRR